MNEYLIAANSKKSMLIFNMFRPIDLAIAITGGVVTFVLFLIFQPSSLWGAVAVLLPLGICTFLVIPFANYHNMLCVIQNIYKFYTEQREFKWKGWCCKDEYK